MKIQPEPSSTTPQFEPLQRHFAAELADIDRALLAYVSSMDQPAGHYGMLSYHFGFSDSALQPLPEAAYLPRGKRLRPLICLLLCRIFALPQRIVTPLMMATEVMHSASLTHDDIQDRDPVRWNRPTLQAAFGLAQAINAGDALIGMVYQLLLDLAGQGVAPELTLQIIASFNRAHLKMCEGQHLDLQCRFDGTAGVRGYLDMAERKTGAACICIGESIAILSDLPDRERRLLMEFGRSLGTLYQICDDVRGIWSNPDELGRENGHDVVMHRPSLPLLYASEHGSAALKQVLLGESESGSALAADTLAFVRQELVACGASRHCLDAATQQHEAALAALSALDKEGPETRALRGLLDACLASIGFLA